MLHLAKKHLIISFCYEKIKKLFKAKKGIQGNNTPGLENNILTGMIKCFDDNVLQQIPKIYESLGINLKNKSSRQTFRCYDSTIETLE